jgi:hypothetical protein
VTNRAYWSCATSRDAGVLVGVRVDRAGVAVEDGAYLLARKRLEAALVERLVNACIRSEADFASDAVDFILLHTVF